MIDSQFSDISGRPSEGAQMNKLLIDFKKLMIESNQVQEFHQGVTCDYCEKQDFKDYRYKCVYCKEYNLCGECYELKKVNNNHMIDHPMVLLEKSVDQKFERILSLMNMGSLNRIAKEFQDVIHPTSKCQICHLDPLQGIRFQCEECICYDLCWHCYQKNLEQGDHKKSHQVIVYLNPQIHIFDISQDIEFENNSIGKGCFGSVSIVKIKRTNEKAALKVIDIRGNNPNTKLYRTSFEREIQAYNEIRCSKIVKYYGYQIDEVNKKLYIVMEYLEGGSLNDFINKKDQTISLRRKFSWLLQIIKGLRRMHFKQFIHKDIKPDNILLTSKLEAKIADMGVSCHTIEGYSDDFLAPQSYSAPEVNLGTKFSDKADVFQFGLLTNHIFTFQKHQITRANDKVKYHFPIKTPLFWSLIEKWTDLNPKNRPTSLEIECQLERIDKYFWNNLPMSQIDYIKASTETKDKIFVEIIENYFQSQIQTFQRNYTVIENKMSDEIFSDIISIIFSVIQEKGMEFLKEICQEIKDILNKKYGRFFNVFMAKNQMEGSFSYQKNFYLCIQIDQFKITIFKSPQS